LNWGGTTYAWDSPIVISMFFVFAFFAVLFVYIEMKVAKNPVIPMHLFANRNFVLCCVVVFLMMMGFLGIVFFVPVFYQDVKGSSATVSGLQLLAVIGGFLVFSIITGGLIAKTGHFKIFPPLGGLIASLGFGLAYQFRPDIPQGEVVAYLLIIGIGMGFAFQNCIVILQGSVPKESVPTATTSLTFLQNIGGVVGIAIAGTIVNTVGAQYLKDHFTTDPVQILLVEKAGIAKGVATMFVACVPYTALAAIFSLFLKKVNLSTVVGGESVVM